MPGTATYSPCGKYRYTLTRKIEPADPLDVVNQSKICFLLLNPSTATAETNDPTVAKCCTYARLWGYTDATVINIFAYRSTDPKQLYVIDDPIGAENDWNIMQSVRSSDLVLCAWGRHGAHFERGKIVTAMLRAAGITLYRLELNKDGSPTHPLYQKLSLTPTLWTEADEYGGKIH